MNHVTIAGNLTRNVEVRKTKGGTSVANFTVVVNEDYVNKDGDKVKSSVGVPCEAWSFLAEQMDGLTTKDKVVVTGNLKSFVREEGAKPELCLKVLTVSVVPYKGKKTTKPAPVEDNEPVGAGVGVEGSNGDDIPF
jgi:single-strand DNA-binding protein